MDIGLLGGEGDGAGRGAAEVETGGIIARRRGAVGIGEAVEIALVGYGLGLLPEGAAGGDEFAGALVAGGVVAGFAQALKVVLNIAEGRDVF